MAASKRAEPSKPRQKTYPHAKDLGGSDGERSGADSRKAINF
jgi:hypothetical protein